MTITKEQLEGMFRKPDLKSCKDYVESIGCVEPIRHIQLIRKGQEVLSCEQAHPENLSARISYQFYSYKHNIYTTEASDMAPRFSASAIAMIPDRIVISIPDQGRTVYVREDHAPEVEDDLPFN